MPKHLMGFAALLAGLSLAATPTTAGPAEAPWSGREFVQRHGIELTLAGAPFRFGGMNIEWLGVEDYGPRGKVAPHPPSDFEVEDALATAQEMGARVVRAQTLGDSIACPACLEPAPGVFNQDEFRHLDGVFLSAARHHIRLIVTLTGDCTVCHLSGFPVNTGMNQYLKWFSDSKQSEFYTDPKILAALELHIRTLLEHKNAFTGVAYKDDPTILAWENCNACATELLIGPGNHIATEPAPADLSAAIEWVGKLGRFIKSIDQNHLYLDNSGLFRFTPRVLDEPTTDLVGYEYYPHWKYILHLHVDSNLIVSDSATIVRHGKIDTPVEIGWDRTNWFWQSSLSELLTGIESDVHIAGDGFWALQAHAPNHGWQPVPADDQGWLSMLIGESGEWWAMYYTGHGTRINRKSDMAERAQMLRSHFYRMAGLSVPPHALAPPPEITLISNGAIEWRGSAGAARYSVERAPGSPGPWTVVCDHCVDDDAGAWQEKSGRASGKFWYRVTAINLDGRPSAPSAPVSMP